MIVAAKENYAMSTTQNGNNRGSAAITKNDGNTITVGDAVQIITLEAGTSSGEFAFNVGDGYLYAASTTSNHLKTQDVIKDNGSWSISITSAGVATVKANQSNRNWMRFNTNNSPKIFSCYASGQTDICIYEYIDSTTGGDSGETPVVPTTMPEALKTLFGDYYNGGEYVRETHIYADLDAIKDDIENSNLAYSLGDLFHNPGIDNANVILDRTTKFVGNYLYFDNGVAFGTSSKGTLTQFTWNESYDNSNSEGNAIEPFFVTLKDFADAENNSKGVEGVSLGTGWYVNTNVYSSADSEVIKAAVAFTAPGWTKIDENYIDFTQVTVEVVNGNLVIKLWASAANSELLNDETEKLGEEHLLFSKAIVSVETNISIAEALQIGGKKEHDTYTTPKYTLTGQVKEVKNTTYGNTVITDGVDEILIYGLYSADGKTRYDKMEYKPVVGDTITVTGVLGTYNSSAQMKNGWLLEVVEKHTCSYGEPTCTEPSKCKYCGAVDADSSALGHTEVVDAAVEPTCTEAGKTAGKHCSVCETVIEAQTPVAALGHDYADGVCSICGAEDSSQGGEEPVEPTTVSISIKDYASANSWTNGTKYTTINTDSNVTITCSGGGNTGKYYTSGNNWRIYQNESPKITISANNGKTIVSVKITYSVNNTGTLTLNGVNVTSATVTTVNASSITFGVGNTGSATNGQVRITAIEVIYK